MATISLLITIYRSGREWLSWLIFTPEGNLAIAIAIALYIAIKSTINNYR